MEDKEMRTAKQSIFIWGKTTEEEIIEKIKKSIHDFRIVNMEIQEIKLYFQDTEDGDQKTINKENAPA